MCSTRLFIIVATDISIWILQSKEQSHPPNPCLHLVLILSQGAYTARMVAQFVVRQPPSIWPYFDHLYQGHIGILDRQDMDAFAGIFVAFQKRGKTHDPKGMRLN
jgi:hypothetical protein